MTLPSVLAWLVILVAVPVNWAVVLRLRLLYRERPDNRVLRDRLLVSIVLSMVITIFGAVFLNNGLAVPGLSPFETMVLTRLAVLSLSFPALYWLFLYRRRR